MPFFNRGRQYNLLTGHLVDREVQMVQDAIMMDHYGGYSSMEQPSYFSNQGEFVNSFAPVTPMMNNMGQGTGEPMPRQYNSPYDTTPGACGDQPVKKIEFKQNCNPKRFSCPRCSAFLKAILEHFCISHKKTTQYWNILVLMFILNMSDLCVNVKLGRPRHFC